MSKSGKKAKIEEFFIIQTIVTIFYDTSKIIHYKNRIYNSYTYRHILNAIQIFEVDQSIYDFIKKMF